MNKTSTVLYVEDEESDRFFMQRAFDEAKLGSVLRTVPDGQTAIHYLSGEGVFGDRDQHPVPHLVLLDLKMPQVSGFELLAWIRKHPQYASLPVVVFSSSFRDEDRARAKSLGASEYFEKPCSGMLYSIMVTGLSQRWL